MVMRQGGMQVTHLWILRYGSKRLSVATRSPSRNLRLTALFFSFKRSSSPTLRFFAHKQTLSSSQPVPLCKWEIRSNLQTYHIPKKGLPERAWSDIYSHSAIWHQKTQGSGFSRLAPLVLVNLGYASPMGNPMGWHAWPKQRRLNAG